MVKTDVKHKFIKLDDNSWENVLKEHERIQEELKKKISTRK